MKAITTDEIKALRDKSGVSVMQCKKALEEADGDMQKALVLLRKKSADIASKKAERTLKAGVIGSYVHSSGNVGAMVVLLCETDFVAKNEEFKKLAYDIAMHVTATNPEFLKKEEITEDDKEKVKAAFAKEIEESGKPEAVKTKMMEGKLESYFNEKILLEQNFIKDQSITINGLIESAIQKFGEKTEIAKFVRLSA